MIRETGSRTAVGRPIFVLTLPRSGSTLLRYLLDSHPRISCPPETQIAVLCSSVLECWLNYRNPDDFEERRRLGVQQARTSAKALIRWHLRQSKKELFCDKSLPNVDRAQVLAELFPGSKFLCLYRHPMDFIRSAIEASEFGFSGYGLYPYMVGTVDNFVFGLARAWCEKVAAMIAIEERWPGRCMRISYEEMVTATTTLWERLTGFLGVEPDSEAVERALVTTHLHGHGDHKIGTTERITSESIGRGSSVPVQLLSEHGLANLNSLMTRVGYEPMGLEWNIHPSPLRRGLLDSAHRDALWNSFERRFRSHLGRLQELASTSRADFNVRILVEEFDNPRGWLIDARKAELSEDRESASPLVQIVARWESLEGIGSGLMSLSDAISRGGVRVGFQNVGDRPVHERPLSIVSALLRPDPELPVLPRLQFGHQSDELRDLSFSIIEPQS